MFHKMHNPMPAYTCWQHTLIVVGLAIHKNAACIQWCDYCRILQHVNCDHTNFPNAKLACYSTPCKWACAHANSRRPSGNPANWRVFCARKKTKLHPRGNKKSAKSNNTHIALPFNLLKRTTHLARTPVYEIVIMFSEFRIRFRTQAENQWYVAPAYLPG